MNVMLLAAGEGRRLRPFTEHAPKPAIPFLTVPLACYSMALLEKTKINHLVVNTHHRPKQIEDLFYKLPSQSDQLFFSNEPTLLGSGGGVQQAENWLKSSEDFFLMNADEVILPQKYWILDEMLKSHQWHQSLATLLVIKHPEVGARFGGAWIDPDQNIQCFSKTAVNGLQGMHYIGVCLLSPRIFSYFDSPIREVNLLYETLTKAIANGESVKTFECEAQWFETGDPESFLTATKQLLQEVTLTSDGCGHEFLRQVIRRHGGTNPVIEESPLKDQVLKAVQLWRNGDDLSK